MPRRRGARQTGRRAAAFALACGIVLALAVLAGCGGSSSGTPKKADYVANINRICATEQQELTEVALSKTKLPAKVIESNRVREKSTEAIAAVKLPASGEAISAEWLATRKRGVAVARRIATLGFASAAARPLNREFFVLMNEDLHLALANGLTSCRGFASI